MTNEDDRLIERCAEDPSAFRELVRRFQPRVYGYLISMTNRDSADDLFQETWLRVLKASPRYESRGQAAAWLFKIARGLALNHATRARTLSPLDAASRVAESSPQPPARAENAELKLRLARAVASLPADQREIFLLRELGELTFQQIADELGVPLGTALSRMNYALKKLRADLGADYA